MALYNGVEESNPQYDALQAQLDAVQSNADAYLSNNDW